MSSRRTRCAHRIRLGPECGGGVTRLLRRAHLFPKNSSSKTHWTHADCQVIDTCCSCSALNIHSYEPSCTAICVQSACDADWGSDSMTAVYLDGRCELEVVPILVE